MSLWLSIRKVISMKHRNNFEQHNVFAHAIKTLRADELEQVAGGPDDEGPTFGTKNLSAQDNQVKCMS